MASAGKASSIGWAGAGRTKANSAKTQIKSRDMSYLIENPRQASPHYYCAKVTRRYRKSPSVPRSLIVSTDEVFDVHPSRAITSKAVRPPRLRTTKGFG